MTTPAPHPLPWHLPGRENWVHLEPGDGTDLSLPYQLRLGQHDSIVAAMSTHQMRALRDAIDAALAGPTLVLILGGPVAEPWMVAAVSEQLDPLVAAYPNLVVAHAGREGSVDEVVNAWATTHSIPVRYGPMTRPTAATASWWCSPAPRSRTSGGCAPPPTPASPPGGAGGPNRQRCDGD